MKKTMLLALLIASTVCVAQNPSQEQAEDYMHKMEAWQDRDVTINDSLYKLLDGHSKRDIVVKGRDIYKIMFVKETPQYSASYIFLDGNTLSLSKINATRKKILSKYKSGTTFSALIAEYNMDKNPKADNMVFTTGVMVPEFEKAVKEHAPGELYTIDVPGSKWYYVAKTNAAVPSQKTFRIRHSRYPY
jgi:parvulin-like peptidyl-prolyl isomerase